MDIYEKSLEVMKKIFSQKEFKIYLVGGWAVWAYNPYLKSKDIDIIVEEKDLWKLRNFLLSIGFRETARVLQKHGFAMLWETDKIEIDVYTEKLGLWKTEDMIRNYETKNMEGVKVSVISLENLFMVKAFTSLERLGTAKGEKDLSDILALLAVGFEKLDFQKLKKEVDTKRVFSLMLRDYQTASRIYPLPLETYKKIKAKINL